MNGKNIGHRPPPIHLEWNYMFWLHVLVTLLAWIGPFIINWWVMVAIYGLVLLQFLVLNRCVMNAGHELEEGEGVTFYAYLLEKAGIHFPRVPLKKFVRGQLYLWLSVGVIVLQTVAGYRPLIDLTKWM
jgi:hypothetical protein